MLTRPSPEVQRCRSCRAEVYWVTWASGKKMPVDVVSDNRPLPKGGNLVLSLGADGGLKVEKFDVSKHAGRNRYTSHFTTCEQAGEWRRDR